jgi:hypothetical protein
MSRTLGEMLAAFKVIMADHSRHADSITDDEVAAFIHNILHP